MKSRAQDKSVIKYRRIAIFGGTFNPIHVGHLVAALTALELMRLDQVIFVVSNHPPHKKDKYFASSRDRLNLVQLAVQGHQAFRVSDCEIKRGGKSYSIDTVEFFRKKFPPPTKLFFIIGGDELNALPTWKDYPRLLERVTFVAVNRPGYQKNIHSERIPHKDVEMPAIDLSSSLIRDYRRKGKSIRWLVPERVALYIEKKGLYL